MKRILLPLALLAAIVFTASPALAHHHHGSFGGYGHHHSYGFGGFGMPYYGGYGGFGVPYYGGYRGYMRSNLGYPGLGAMGYGYPGLYGPMMGGYYNGLNFGIGGGF